MKRVPFILIGLLFWLGFYIGTFKVLEFIRGIVFFGEILSKKLLSIAFFSLGIFVDAQQCYYRLIFILYLKRHTVPYVQTCRIRHILGLKTVETVTSSSWMVLSFIPPSSLME